MRTATAGGRRLPPAERRDRRPGPRSPALTNRPAPRARRRGVARMIRTTPPVAFRRPTWILRGDAAPEPPPRTETHLLLDPGFPSARGARRGRASRRPRTARKLAGWPLGGGGRAPPRAVRTERRGERRTSHTSPSVAAGVPEPPGPAPGRPRHRLPRDG